MGRVFALLPAAQVRTSVLTGWERRLFNLYGDVKAFDTALARFDADTLINLVIRETADYDTVVLVAHSFSLMLAHDIASKLRASGDTRDIVIVSIDGLSHKRHTVGSELLWLARWLLFGPVFNRLSRLVWRFAFRPDDPLTTRPTNLNNLLDLHESYRSFLLSAYTDQLRYIDRHPPLDPIENVRCVWVVSAKDSLIKASSREDCIVRGVFAGNEVFIVEEAGHLALHDWPDNYKHVLLAVLESLGMKQREH